MARVSYDRERGEISVDSLTRPITRENAIYLILDIVRNYKARNSDDMERIIEMAASQMLRNHTKD